MRIAVKDAVDRDLFHIGRQQVRRDRFRIVLRKLGASDVGQVTAFDKAERQHAR